MATHSSVLAWRIPWTEKPGRLQSWGRTESDTTEATWQQGESLLVTSYSIADAYSPSDLELQNQEALYQKVLVGGGCLIEIHLHDFLLIMGKRP